MEWSILIGSDQYLKCRSSFRLIDDEQPNDLDDAYDFGWKKYNDLDKIYKWLDHLLEKHPNVLTNYNYGTSYEGRTLRAVKVSHKKVRETEM